MSVAGEHHLGLGSESVNARAFLLDFPLSNSLNLFSSMLTMVPYT